MGVARSSETDSSSTPLMTFSSEELGFGVRDSVEEDISVEEFFLSELS